MKMITVLHDPVILLPFKDILLRTLLLDDPIILLPFKDILLRTLLLDDPVTLLLLEDLLSTFTSLCPAAAGTLFTTNLCLVKSCCGWNIIYYKLLPPSSNPAAFGTLFTINFYLRRLILLLLEHYLLSTFTSVV